MKGHICFAHDEQKSRFSFFHLIKAVACKPQEYVSLMLEYWHVNSWMKKGRGVGC